MTKFGRLPAISVITLLPGFINAMAQTGPSFNILYDFGSNGGYESGMITLGPGGVLNGITGDGRPGIVYSLTPPASPGGSWTETILHDLAGGSGVAIGNGGVLYGAAGGGAAHLGTIYSLTPPASPGGPWTETILYAVPSMRAGSNPSVPIVGADGVLYCTSFYGGTAGFGTAFSLSPPSTPGGAWTKHVLYSFQGGSDGAYPQGLSAIGGVLYGTTQNGGSTDFGTVFSLTPSSSPGEPWTETVIYTFASGNDGKNPNYGLAGDSNGVIYGTAGGGSQGDGVVYSLTRPASPGGSWTENVLYSFRGEQDGRLPQGVLAIGSGGVLYGVTYGGGLSFAASGVVFALEPPASPGGSWTEVVLHQFHTYPDGDSPNGVVIGHAAQLSRGAAMAGARYSPSHLESPRGPV